MGTQKIELSEMLRFDPGWIKDPVPWLIPYLDKEQIIQTARIQIEFQRAVQAAHSKALQEFESILK
jgi:hypothetical protein